MATKQTGLSVAASLRWHDSGSRDDSGGCDGSRMSTNSGSSKAEFPIFTQTNRGKPLVYLDSASTAQKPQRVIDVIANFYSHDYANVHRGIYELSERSSLLYEEARQAVKQFINAKHTQEIIFTSGTTESINLIAQSLGREKWRAGDEVILSEMEHHSNIVPWYMLKQQIGIELKIIPITEAGELDIEVYKSLFSSRTKLVAITHASNVLGTINPVEEITRIAHTHDVPVLLDGAQAVPHMPVNMQDIDCDFYAFSAHKLYGPTGIGVLYGKKKLLDKMTPYQGGGSMIDTVSFDKVTYASSPLKFEAGTPNISAVVGMHAAIDYVQEKGMNAIHAHEQSLLDYAQGKLAGINGLRIIGYAKEKVGVISFVMKQAHPHDIGTVLDHEGIAIRAGHHCAMPLMERFNVPAMVRVSFGIYNTKQDVDKLIEALQLAERMFS